MKTFRNEQTDREQRDKIYKITQKHLAICRLQVCVFAIYNHTAYIFTYIGQYIQVRVHSHCTLLIFIANIYKMCNCF